jgi:hypothetical protein
VPEEEQKLSQRQTAWIRGATSAKMGHAVLTTQRLVFFDEKFAPNAALGLVGNVIFDRLQKKHEKGGPLVEIPLGAITGLARRTKLLGKDRIAITTPEGEFLFSNGWKAWSQLLKDTLTTRFGRRVVEETPDSWRIEPA